MVATLESEPRTIPSSPRTRGKMSSRTTGPAGKVASADVTNPGMPDQDGVEEALVCRDFSMSAAQQAYQKDAHRQDLEKDETIFYKDATPKAEHYMSFRIDLPANVARKLGPKAVDVALAVELVAVAPRPSGTGGTASAGHYEPVADQSHLKACMLRVSGSQTPVDRPVTGVTLAYRVELGSYRQGDRRFALLVRVAPKVYQEWPVLRAVAPCLTPAVYVASKVKRHRAHAHDDVNHDDVGAGPKRRETESLRPRSPPLSYPQIDPAVLTKLLESCERLDRQMRHVVLPSLARIEAHLNTQQPAYPGASAPAPPPDAESVEALFAAVPALGTLDRGNSEQLINNFYGTNGTTSTADYFSPLPETAEELKGGTWADAMKNMGNGLKEAMDASSLDNPSTAFTDPSTTAFPDHLPP